MKLEGLNFPKVPMKRIISHWTAGAHTANRVDRKAYHFLTEGDGSYVQGIPTVDKNSGHLKSGYAAHTLNCNTDSIGASMCCMAGAREAPFDPGAYPMTETQFENHCQLVAHMCEFYNIPVIRKTCLTHAEVQEVLGIRQRNKWDFTRLAFKPELRGAKACGDYLRSRVRHYMDVEKVFIEKPIELPVPEGATAIVVTNESDLTLRNGAGIDTANIGSLPKGLKVEVLDTVKGWYQVQTPFGAVGWASSKWMEVIDGPQPSAPTKPDKQRLIDEAMVDLRDATQRLEELLKT